MRAQINGRVGIWHILGLKQFLAPERYFLTVKFNTTLSKIGSIAHMKQMIS